ncbi:hypothetical protein V8F20_009810 [Naviculisporaceae sp. PSN 640]
MSDPFSITSGCAGLITAIAQAVKVAIHIRNARDDIAAITHELGRTKDVLDELVRMDQEHGSSIPRKLKDQIKGIITNCRDVVREIETSLVKIRDMSRLRVAITALMGESDLKRQLKTMEAHKAALKLVLDLWSLHLAQENRGNTAQILHNTELIKTIMPEILSYLDNPKAQAVANYRLRRETDARIQRYLEELTTYTENELQSLGPDEKEPPVSPHAIKTSATPNTVSAVNRVGKGAGSGLNLDTKPVSGSSGSYQRHDRHRLAPTNSHADNVMLNQKLFDDVDGLRYACSRLSRALRYTNGENRSAVPKLVKILQDFPCSVAHTVALRASGVCEGVRRQSRMVTDVRLFSRLMDLVNKWSDCLDPSQPGTCPPRCYAYGGRRWSAFVGRYIAGRDVSVSLKRCRGAVREIQIMLALGHYCSSEDIALLDKQVTKLELYSDKESLAVELETYISLLRYEPLLRKAVDLHFRLERLQRKWSAMKKGREGSPSSRSGADSDYETDSSGGSEDPPAEAARVPGQGRSQSLSDGDSEMQAGSHTRSSPSEVDVTVYPRLSELFIANELELEWPTRLGRRLRHIFL